jgi:hypothetical protein
LAAFPIPSPWHLSNCDSSQGYTPSHSVAPNSMFSWFNSGPNSAYIICEKSINNNDSLFLYNSITPLRPLTH